MQINIKSVTADYRVGPIRSPEILKEVTTTFPSSSFTAVVGHTGSGKSSLLKLTNGLLLPTSGHVEVGEAKITASSPKKELKAARKKVGMVFQFPENQLFAETVEKDIIFGPLNFGLPFDKAKEIAKDVIQRVGLDISVLGRSPFSLSGGQKRRVAISGILAMKPNILVLDEPGAGLDPKGKKEIMTLLRRWHEEQALTTIFVTHDMDDVAEYADEVIVMDKGEIAYKGDVREVFSDVKQVEAWHLDLPEARRFQLRLQEEKGIVLKQICLTMDELVDALVEVGMV